MYIINDLGGKQIEIKCTLVEAKQQCREAIQFLENKAGIKYPSVLEEWKHDLLEIEKLEISINNLKTGG